MLTLTLPDDEPDRVLAVHQLYIELQDLYEWDAMEDAPDSEPRIPAPRRHQFEMAISLAFLGLASLRRPLKDAARCPVCGGRPTDHRRDGSYAPGCPACGNGTKP